MNGFVTAPDTAAQEKPQRRVSPPRLLISAAAFGIAFSAMFVNQRLGLNLTIFFLLIYAFMAFNAKQVLAKTFRQERLLYLMAIPVVFLSVSFFVMSSQVLGLNVLAILAVMLVQYTVLSGSALNGWDEGGFIVDLVFTGINRFLFGFPRFMVDGGAALFKGRKKAGVLIGIGAGALLLLIVLPLLVSADAAMSSLLGRFFERLALENVFAYLFMFLLGASLIMAGAATAGEPEYTGLRSAFHVAKRPIPAVTTGVALTMVAAVYVLFAGMQFRYFFAPAETIASVLGLTSSAYAVRGFTEMLTITCLNFALISAALRWTQQAGGETQPYLKALYVLLVVFNFVILASAHIRMEAYVASFGQSVARFMSHSFMLLLAVLNGVMLARIFCGRVKLVRLFAAASLIYLCALTAVGPERYVAAQNISRCVQTGKLDVEYVLSLPGDALADSCEFLIDHPELFDEAAYTQASHAYVQLRDKQGSWMAYNLADERAKEKLSELLRAH